MYINRFQCRTMKQKLAVSDLELGMYVSELDCPWLDTPYLLQGLLIERQEDIKELSKYCAHVYIDTLRSRESPRPALLGAEARVPPAAGRSQFHGTQIYVNTLAVEEELPVARRYHEEATDLAKLMMQAMSSELRVDMQAAKQAVDGLRESIIRNPDALMLLSRMRSTSSKEYQRAIEVAVYLLAFGRELGLPKEDLSDLGLGGLMLDIGKLHLPKELLEKDASYTPAEYRLIKRHVYYGNSMLRKRQDISERVLRMVSEHHERENGSGYPHGLVSDQISAFGRMAAIVDCYTEMVTPRSRSIHVSPHDALEMLHGWSGQQFHPALVEAFIQCIGIFPVGSLVELNTGEVGIVLSRTRGSRLRPRLLLIRDARKQPYQSPRQIDLAAAPGNEFGIAYQISRSLEFGMYGVRMEDIALPHLPGTAR